MKMYIFQNFGKNIDENKILPGFTTRNVENEKFIHSKDRPPSEFYPLDTTFSPIELVKVEEESVEEKFELADIHHWILKKPRGIIWPISNKFKVILDSMNLQNIALYKGAVDFYGKLETYWFIHIDPLDYIKLIDFERSLICQINFFTKERIGNGFFKVKNREEILNLKRELNWNYWGFHKAVMKTEFEEIDLINVQPYGTLISEKLKNEIEKNNLTGMKITDCPIEFEISNDEIS